MEQINFFHKGVVSGLDYSKVENDRWVFPSQNVRILNKEGKGLIVTLLKGVEKIFDLTTNFECIGAVLFDGIIYIVSYNRLTKMCELGCYPSPACYNVNIYQNIELTSDTGFEFEYKPLANLIPLAGDTVRKPFRTDKLYYDEKIVLDIIPVFSFDQSVDLIIIDGKNSNKIINSGFDKLGVLNSRVVNDIDFKGALDQIKSTETYPEIDWLYNAEDYFAARNLADTDYIQNGPPNQTIVVHWGIGTGKRIKMDDEYVPSGNYVVGSDGGYYLVPITDSYRFNATVVVSAKAHYFKPFIDFVDPPIASYYLDLVRDRAGIKTTIATVQKSIVTNEDDFTSESLSINTDYIALESGDKVYLEIKVNTITIDIDPQSSALFETTIEKSGTGWYLVNDVNSQKSIVLNSGGRLLPGNYFLFVRYSSFDFNRTKFISIFGPLPVYENMKVAEVEGTLHSVPTTKKLDIIFSNLDVSYEYFEIGVIRYFGDLGYPQREIYLIENRYSTREHKVSITGNEKHLSLTFAEVTDYNGVEKTCKTQRIINNRYYGANWKGIDVDYQKLAELALTIIPQYTISKSILDTNITEMEGGYADSTIDEMFYGYKSLESVVLKAGYHRGATVPFGVRFILTDGTKTPAFPVRGYDCYNGTAGNSNTKGLFRFPFYNSGYLGELAKINDIKNVLGIRFTTSYLDNYLDSNPALANVVKGLIFVRSDEQENLLYQGVGGHMVSSVIENDPGNMSAVRYDTHFPLTNKMIPLLGYTTGEGGNQEYADAQYYADEDAVKFAKKPNKKLLYLYSPDLLFNQVNRTFVGRKYFVQIIGHSTSTDGTQTLLSDNAVDHYLNPRLYAKDILRFNINPGGISACQTIIVDKGSNPVFNGNVLLSRALPGQFTQLFTTIGEDVLNEKNRTMVSPRYMGIELPANINLTDAQMLDRQYLINVYSDDPTSENYFSNLVSNFNPFNNTYSEIMMPLFFPEINDVSYYDCFHGNSFQTRVFFRQTHWESLFETSEESGDDPYHAYFAHGLLMGMFVESFCNPAYRHGDSENTYYPKVRTQSVLDNQVSVVGNAYQFIRNKADLFIYESFFYNSGYTQSVIDSLMYGYDPATPFFTKRYPARIRASAKHNDTSFMSGYSLFSSENFVDFDLKGGEIIYLGELNDELVSVQENRIIQHYIDERALKTDDSDQSLILGYGPIISKEYKVLAEYGSQHKNGVNMCSGNLYGIDVRGSKLWVVMAQTTQYGKVILGSQDLTQEAMIESEMAQIYSDLEIVSNKVVPFADNPISNNGVFVGYDPSEKEVYFIFKNKTELRGLVFSEKIASFTGSYDNLSAYFVHDTSQCLSYYHGAFYKHNVGNLKHDNTQIELILSYIVNGLNEKQNTAIYSKVFESQIVEMPMIKLDSLNYETETQSGIRIPFDSTDEAYFGPVYENHAWTIPMILADEGSQQYEVASEFMGTWLKVTMKTKNTTNLFIRSVRNLFNLIKP